ncbi:PfkB family carbohydrate kinase [Puerhibacterium sp. TATVAM-FAB25]|uniref:PfkB family carbohydrate kinase n=1 Tax=Puerhibacterium sp. TATVAM-FAB25 TaxID=3093699 RepID=UPI00397BB4A3
MAPVCWFAGLTTLDVVHRAAAPPGRDRKITASRQDVAAGGPAANAAVTAAALGARAVLVTALGTGPVATAARADLEAHGVEVLDVAAALPAAQAAAFPLAVSAALVDEATGERSVVSADAALAAAPAPAPAALAALPRPDAVLLDGHHPAIARAVLAHVDALGAAPRRFPPEDLPEVADAQGGAGPAGPDAGGRPFVVLDCGRWRPLFAELVPAADVAACSADFTVPADVAPRPGLPAQSPLTTPADAVPGVAPPTPDQRVAAAVLALGARAVVVTHGPGPVDLTTTAFTFPDGSPYGQAVQTSGVTAVDTLGAGDAFHGALTAALATGRRLSAAVGTATAVATERVQHVGPRGWLSAVRPLTETKEP